MKATMQFNARPDIHYPIRHIKLIHFYPFNSNIFVGIVTSKIFINYY